MMNVQSVRIGGCVVFFKLSKYTDVTVRDKLEDLGFSKCLPEERSFSSCLREAVNEVVVKKAPKDSSKRILRPIENGFAVVVGNDENMHCGDDWGKVDAKVTCEDFDQPVSVSPYEYDTARELKDSIDLARTRLSAISMSLALVKVIEQLDGVTLRENGGTYWIDQSKMDRFRQAADAIEDKSIVADGSKKSLISSLSVCIDEQMITAVGDALITEISQGCKAIADDIAGCSLNKRSCETRVKRTEEMLAKLERYERAFGMPMEVVKEKLGETRVALLTASLQSAAASSLVAV